jgi:hypothetical protein
MGGGITGLFAFVVAGRDHLTVAEHHSADRHVAVRSRDFRLVEGPTHRLLVGGSLLGR